MQESIVRLTNASTSARVVYQVRTKHAEYFATRNGYGFIEPGKTVDVEVWVALTVRERARALQLWLLPIAQYDLDEMDKHKLLVESLYAPPHVKEKVQ